MVAPIILVEAQPRRAADGVTETVRLAGGGGALPYYYAGLHYRAGIEALPTVVASLNYDGEIVGGGVAEAMTISFAPNSQAVIDNLSRFYWGDAPVAVRVGPEGALPPVLTLGKVLDVATSEGKLAIALADPAADVMKPVPATRYAGTGDLEGPADWADKIKRRLWGQVWNIEAEPIDAASNIYCLSDPTRPLHGIVAVRDRGVAVTITVLAWQGSVAATLAALRAAAVTDGEAIVCPSIACIKFWTEPSALHADAQGEVGASYVETAAEIGQRLVEALAGPAFATGTVAAAALLRPAPVGWVVSDDSTTVAAMLDQLLADNSLMWLLDAGAIVLRPWAWGAPVASAVSEDVVRKKSFAPVATRRLGYRRNESPMARGDLAAIVLASDVTYPDGTVAADVQPAEAGATAGAPAGTMIDTVAAEDVSETIAPGGGVAADQVKTPSLVAGAVTAANRTTNSGAVAGNGNWRTLTSQTIVMDYAGSILAWADASQTFSAGPKTWDYRIVIGGTAVNLVGGDAVQAAIALSARLAVGVGSVTVTLEARAADNTVAVAAGRASLVVQRCYR
ncbi:MAG: hypothetical protein ABIV36_21625 [Sphingobium limneticum]